MSEEMIVSLIASGVTLIGVLMSNSKHQAVIDTKIEELTREVREHNNFARRIPVVENDIAHIEDTLEELKGYHK